MNKYIKSLLPIPEDSSVKVFLAGPMRGAPKWQKTVPSLAESLGIDGVTFLSPCPSRRWIPFEQQADWETEGLTKADIVLFWIPNQETETPGRDYAQTTRMELLESLALGRTVILGIDSDIRASRYLHYKAKAYGLEQVHSSLEDCLKELSERLKS